MCVVSASVLGRYQCVLVRAVGVRVYGRTDFGVIALSESANSVVATCYVSECA